MKKMTDKDNIKLKTDTLSSRKSSSSAGVHVKRKRKILVKPTGTQTSDPSRSIKKEVKNGAVKENSSNEITISKVPPVKEVNSVDSKPTKKHKIDKD